MSIHPRFANAILSGTKTVEYRKRGLAPDIQTVLIYATSPTQRIVGQFTVAEQLRQSPDALWKRTRLVGGVERRFFDDYYSGTVNAVGIVVADFQRFEHPWTLDELAPGLMPPQSFLYLDVLTHPRIADIAGTPQQLELIPQ